MATHQFLYSFRTLYINVFIKRTNPSTKVQSSLYNSCTKNTYPSMTFMYIRTTRNHHTSWVSLNRNQNLKYQKIQADILFVDVPLRECKLYSARNGQWYTVCYSGKTHVLSHGSSHLHSLKFHFGRFSGWYIKDHQRWICFW